MSRFEGKIRRIQFLASVRFYLCPFVCLTLSLTLNTQAIGNMQDNYWLPRILQGSADADRLRTSENGVI